MAQKIYLLEHLGCANCAAKIEREIAALPGIQSATITFATRQLLVAAEDPDSYLSEMQRIANSHEPDIVITERKRKTHQHSSAPNLLEHEEQERDGCGYSREGHHQHDGCGCGHSHEEHHHEGCSCGHSHEAPSIPHETSPHRPLSASAVRKVYTIENLDCANCAAAVERKIAAMPEV
ncbi:MAG TPA: cation transporter, partial [Candidatus Limivivens merdigallinarum]|nr:cation transporter [Candidatus Limivivens merdigallinarum]